jgi:hypothetical protein
LEFDYLTVAVPDLFQLLSSEISIPLLAELFSALELQVDPEFNLIVGCFRPM